MKGEERKRVRLEEENTRIGKDVMRKRHKEENT